LRKAGKDTGKFADVPAVVSTNRCCVTEFMNIALFVQFLVLRLEFSAHRPHIIIVKRMKIMYKTDI